MDDDDIELRRPITERDDAPDDDDSGDPFEDEATRTPVHVVGTVIARSPVGAWWCAFVDACGSPGRADRGRAYVRAGALLDLKVRPGCITAELDAAIRLRPMVSVPLPTPERQAAIRAQVGLEAGATLQDTLPGVDLLPASEDLLGSCGCTDRVLMCEHVMAALYGFAARLDAEPELLLVLRGAAVASSSASTSLVIAPLAPGKVALTGGLAALFGLNLRDEPPPGPEAEPAQESSPDVADVAAAPEAQESPPDMTAGTPEPATRVGDAGVRPPENATGPGEPLREVRRDYLKFIGIRSRTIDIWAREGVLLPTDRFHVYLRTPEADRRIAAKLAR